MKKTIAVLFGGCSSEHEISRLSAATVLRNLSRDKYDVLSVGITKSGRWFLTKATPEQVETIPRTARPSSPRTAASTASSCPPPARRCASTR